MPGIVSNPVALYLGGNVPKGTRVQGHFLIGDPGYDYSHNYGGYTWFPGPDEANAYLLAKFVGNHPSFWRTTVKSDKAFIDLFNSIAPRLGTTRVHSISDARTWLDDNNFLYTNTLTPGSKSMLVFGETAGGNLAYGVLNYSGETTNVFDTGLASSGWDIYDCLPITGKGYMVVYNDTSFGTNWNLLFLNAQGILIDAPTFTGLSNPPYDALDGQWAYFLDQTGTLKYFDGDNVYTHTFDGTNYTLNISWDFDSTILNGSFLFNLIKNSDSSGTVNIVKSDGSIVTTRTFNGLTTNITAIVYSIADYLIYLTTNPASGNITNIEICANDGVTTLYNIDTSSYTNYQSLNTSYYGPSSFMLVAWNNGNVNDPYLIVNYEGSTNILIQITHARGTNYVNPQIVTISAESNLDTDPNNGYLILYSNYTPDGFLLDVDYLDVVYFITGESSQRTYTVTAGTTTPVYLGGIGIAKSLFLGYVTGSPGQFTIKTFNGASVTDNDLWVNSDISYINQCQFGTSFLVAIVSVSDGIGRMWILNEAGSIVDLTTFANGSVAFTISYDSIYITDATNSWYMNSVSPGFNSITYYSAANVPNYYQTQYNPGIIFLWSVEDSKMSVITRTGYSGDIVLPSLDRLNYYGKDYFISLAKDISGNYSLELYDLDVSLLNTDVTGSSNANQFDIIEDRAFVSYQSGTPYKADFITPSSIGGVTLYSAKGYVPNDYIWWTNNWSF